MMARTRTAEDAAEKPVALELSADTLTRLPDIIKRLETEFTGLWDYASKSNNFKKIKQFADQIQYFGEAEDVSILQTYGQDLEMFTDSFDIEKMQVHLENYPDLVQRLKEVNDA